MVQNPQKELPNGVEVYTKFPAGGETDSQTAESPNTFRASWFSPGAWPQAPKGQQPAAQAKATAHPRYSSMPPTLEAATVAIQSPQRNQRNATQRNS